METRANYVLIGAFALAGFLGIFAFFLLFASLELDRQFAYYDVDFRTVAGLTDASDVRFAGLPVGQVVEVRLSPENDGQVRVRVEVDAETPVRTDSIATIEAQGVTGVSYVSISAGSSGAPLLAEASGESVPMIEPGQSVLQSLSEDAPEILAETLAVVRDLRQLIGGENQLRVNAILANVEQSSAAFADALGDFTDVTATVSTFARQIDRFNTTLDTLTQDASGVLEAATTTLGSIDTLSQDMRGLVSEGSAVLSRAETAITSADAFIADDLAPAADEFRSAVAGVEDQAARLADAAGALMTTYDETGKAATARLTEAGETIASANALIARTDGALASVDSAARRFEGVLAEDAEPLIEDLRRATTEATAVIRRIGETANTDLPAIIAEIRAAVDEASGVIETVGRDLSSASGRIDGLTETTVETLEGVRATFARANETLTAINGALDTGDRALDAAEKAFSGADRVLNEEVSDIVARLKATLDTLDAAVATVADEVPAVAEDIRAASRSAQSALAGIEGAVADSAPAVRDFASTALPQFGRLAVEARTLVDNLDALVEQIRRDPSRFLLDPRAPEFSR